VSGTFWQATQPVSAATLPLPSGAATAAKQPALGTAGSASADVITVQGVTSMTPLKVDGSGVTQPVSIAAHVTVDAGTNTSTAALAVETGGNLATLAGAVSSSKVQTNVAQVAGTTADTNSGNKSNGTLRVVLATDQPALTNAQPVALKAAASGGATPGHLVSAASTNATNVKASAGTIYSLSGFNLNASPRYLKIYDKASSPTVGTDTPVAVFMMPGNANGSGFSKAFSVGLALSNGFSFAITGGIADNDTTAVGAGDCVINYSYN